MFEPAAGLSTDRDRDEVSSAGTPPAPAQSGRAEGLPTEAPVEAPLEAPVEEPVGGPSRSPLGSPLRAPINCPIDLTGGNPFVPAALLSPRPVPPSAGRHHESPIDLTGTDCDGSPPGAGYHPVGGAAGGPLTGSTPGASAGRRTRSASAAAPSAATASAATPSAAARWQPAVSAAPVIAGPRVAASAVLRSLPAIVLCSHESSEVRTERKVILPNSSLR